MKSKTNSEGIKSPVSSAYIILPDGTKRYVRATMGDIIISLILPFWGLLVGLAAVSRGEKMRGFTMVYIGIAELALLSVFRSIH